MARTLTLKQGQPLDQAKVEGSTDFLEWGGEQARPIADRVVAGRTLGSRIEIQNHPIGVMAAFTPWNFPMALASKKFAGAWAGCATICMPSQGTPGCVLAMATALLEAGVPPAAIAGIFGHAGPISDHLIEATETGRRSLTCWRESRMSRHRWVWRGSGN